MKYKVTVTGGVDYRDIAGLTKYELDSTLEQLTEWFPDITFDLTAEPNQPA